MEFILIMGAIVFVLYLLSRGDNKTTSQPAQPWELRNFKIRLHDTRQEDKGHSFIVKKLQAIGRLPVTRQTNLGMCVSVMDKDRPVICHIETFQEPESPAYYVQQEMGLVGPNQGLDQWATITGIIPEIFHPPYGGLRQLKMVVRLIDLSNPPTIRLGSIATLNHPGLLWSTTIGFTHEFTKKGYREEAKDRQTAMTLSLKMAMAVAMADGNLHKQEGDALKKAVLRLLVPYSDEQKQRIKNTCNQAMKEGYAESKRGALNLKSLARQLNNIDNQQIRYETLQLCTDVMTADGVADSSELKLLHHIGDLIGLDMQQMKKIIDTGLVKQGVVVPGKADPGQILGIDPRWNTEQIKKHLLEEFRKWNGRLNTLPEGSGRDNAQRMLNLIAKARKQHG